MVSKRHNIALTDVQDGTYHEVAGLARLRPLVLGQSTGSRPVRCYTVGVAWPGILSLRVQTVLLGWLSEVSTTSVVGWLMSPTDHRNPDSSHWLTPYRSQSLVGWDKFSVLRTHNITRQDSYNYTIYGIELSV